VRYGYAPICFGYEENGIIYNGLNMRTAPGMPTYLKVGRGRKTQAIGSIVYNTLLNDIRGNTTSAADYSFSDYHASLPNFLKYPEDPSSE
jgi:hypothetical protein